MKFLETLRDTLFFNLGPGPNILPIRYIINLQKGGTIFWCLYLMSQYNNPENELINVIYTGKIIKII